MGTSNEVAKPGHVFICAACGRRSRDRYGDQKLDRSWDSACVLNAVEVTEEAASKARVENGLSP